MTGYAVALRGDTTQDGAPVWFSGGKLAADLTMPSLRHRSEPVRATPPPADQFTSAERTAIWEHAARVAAEASGHIRSAAVTNPGEAADAAWVAADALHVAAALGSRVLRRAADSYDRAARFSYGRLPRPTRAGNTLRYAARLLARIATTADDDTLALVDLIVQLAALVEAVTELRHTQQHAAQALPRIAPPDSSGRQRITTPALRPAHLGGPGRRPPLPTWPGWTFLLLFVWSRARFLRPALRSQHAEIYNRPVGDMAHPRNSNETA